jgi:hypothetical protein
LRKVSATPDVDADGLAREIYYLRSSTTSTHNPNAELADANEEWGVKGRAAGEVE